MGDPVKPPLPPGVPGDIARFTECTLDALVLRGGKVPWIKDLLKGELGDLGGMAPDPTVKLTPGPAGAIHVGVGVAIDLGLGAPQLDDLVGFDLSVNAAGELQVTGASAFDDAIQRWVRDANAWLKHNHKKLKPPQLQGADVTLTKVPIEAGQPVPPPVVAPPPADEPPPPKPTWTPISPPPGTPPNAWTAPGAHAMDELDKEHKKRSRVPAAVAAVVVLLVLVALGLLATKKDAPGDAVGAATTTAKPVSTPSTTTAPGGATTLATTATTAGKATGGPISYKTLCSGPSCYTVDKASCDWTFHYELQILTDPDSFVGKPAVIATPGIGLEKTYDVTVGPGGKVTLDAVVHNGALGGTPQNGCAPTGGAHYTAYLTSVDGRPTITPNPPP